MTYREDDDLRLDQLTEAERLAFGALLRILVALDGEISDEERAVLEAQAADLGEEDYWAMIEQASEEVDAERARKLAEAVTRQPVRDLIFASLYEAATAGTITESEMLLLDELRNMWGVLERTLDD